jgi:hypothetical protein
MGPTASRASVALGVVAFAVSVPTAARAQNSGSLLVTPVLPPGFSSVEDQGVAERARPDWQALGLRLGAFTLRPMASIAAGATSNAYLTRADNESSAFATTSAAVDLASGWSRHYLSLRASGQLTNFAGKSELDTKSWLLGASGRYDIHSTLQVAASGDVARDNESRFEGEAISANFAVSPFIRESAAIRANYNPGRLGVQLTANYRHLHFLPVTFQDGSRADQSIRDRGFADVALQGTYARTPSFGLFALVGASRTRFDEPGTPQLLQSDSDGVRVLGGLNLQLEGFATGSLGVGWSRRRYDDARIGTHSGLSVETRVELLPRDTTTITVNARRQLSDANPTTGPFWETLVGVTVDQEVRRNIILSATGGYTQQHYLNQLTTGSSAINAGASATYLISRRMEARANLLYRTSDARSAGSLSEARGNIGLVLKI